MDCNKDEAIRARELAEMKMKHNDFEGARKIVLKAQNLYPELENISQLLSICDVNCAAQKMVSGSEKDWYGVLQVAKFADEMAIKKQYRRLALFLHPDKNRFSGAESAFKLICEANAVLSDPQRKFLYDQKIRATVRSGPAVPPHHHLNRNYQFNKQYGAEIKVTNAFHSMNQHQTAQSSFSVRPEVFCTSCPFCCLKYLLNREFVNTTLRCQKCLKTFSAFETAGQGVPMETSQNRGSKQGVQNGKGFSASEMASQWCANNQKVRPQPSVRTESIFKDKGVGRAAKVNGDLKAKRRDSGINKRKGKRRGSESSESYDTSSESDLEDVYGFATELNSGPTNDHFPRRSSRKRQNVSYNEGVGDDDDDDDDLPSSRKRSHGNKLPESVKHENQSGLHADTDFSKFESKETGSVFPEGRPYDKSDSDKGVKKKGDGCCTSNIGADAVETETNSDMDAHSGDDSDNNPGQYDDPEFNDFDKDRDVNCFACNQYWACYDSVDGMPRFYAKVKKVQLSPFELVITWLEADPADDIHKRWVDEDLPVGCGKFKVGTVQRMSNRLTFAQQMHCEKGKRGSLIIHPRRGEVWAIFKDWDLSWSSQPDSHREFKYEVVEVLSDFDVVTGARVCYLDKIGGFVSLFQRSSQSVTETFMIGPNEVYRFSHCIRSFKMTGSERGVPVGSFELDPAALPLNPDHLWYPGKSKMETENVGPGANCAPPKSGLGKGNFVGSDTKVFVDLECSDG